MWPIKLQKSGENRLTQFSSIFTVEFVGESDYFYGFSNDAVTVSVDDSIYTGLEQLYGNIHANRAHENNDNNTAPILIGLHKTKQKTQII
jgi:hypothetical protein